MAADKPIPFFNSLEEIYPSASAVLREGERWNELAKTFEKTYGSAPAHIVRAPGRVNILGEHIDYSLFPVLPAAIEQDIIIALRPTSSETPTVRLANLEPKFKPSEFELTYLSTESGHSEGWDVGLTSPKEGGGWENYFKVAVAEGLGKFFSTGVGASGKRPVGMDLLISGTVPPGSGLSSSAAFVVSSIITFLVANKITDGISKGDVVALAMASEHRMGLQTGGMDQAASALCLANSLLRLDFYPSLDPQPLPLPQSLAVVITNSLAPHHLTSSAPEQYNLRVVEVLVATRLLVNAWGLSDVAKEKNVGDNGRLWLRQALHLWSDEKDEVKLYEKALKEVDRVLGVDGRDAKGWTKEEMIAASGLSPEEFTSTFLDFIEVRATNFHLHKRLAHTLLESLRVSKFAQICASLPSSTPESDPALIELGALLDASHDSLRDLYECTVSQTDSLRDLCKSLGALGSRQTGGGWGGAVISLVRKSQVSTFLKAAREQYGAYAGLSPAAVEEAAFATLPGSGAGVYVVDGEIKA